MRQTQIRVHFSQPYIFQMLLAISFPFSKLLKNKSEPIELKRQSSSVLVSSIGPKRTRTDGYIWAKLHVEPCISTCIYTFETAGWVLGIADTTPYGDISHHVDLHIAVGICLFVAGYVSINKELMRPVQIGLGSSTRTNTGFASPWREISRNGWRASRDFSSSKTERASNAGR